jgi:hypothetical protein
MQSTAGFIKKFRLLTLEKFGADRDRASERMAGANRTGPHWKE